MSRSSPHMPQLVRRTAEMEKRHDPGTEVVQQSGNEPYSGLCRWTEIMCKHFPSESGEVGKVRPP